MLALGPGETVPSHHTASLAAAWHSLSCPRARAAAPSLPPPRAQGAACRKALSPVRARFRLCPRPVPFPQMCCGSAVSCLTERKMSFTVLFSFPSTCYLLLCAILGIIVAQNLFRGTALLMRPTARALLPWRNAHCAKFSQHGCSCHQNHNLYFVWRNSRCGMSSPRPAACSEICQAYLV